MDKSNLPDKNPDGTQASRVRSHTSENLPHNYQSESNGSSPRPARSSSLRSFNIPFPIPSLPPSTPIMFPSALYRSMSLNDDPAGSRLGAHLCTAASGTAAIDILRFVDQIDCFYWKHSGNEERVIAAIYECFSEPLARVWFTRLANRIAPRKLVVNDIRAALLRDFHVEGWEQLMETRYGSGAYKSESKDGIEYIYYHSHQFYLKLSYLDEIEKCKDVIRFRDLGQLAAKERFDEEKEKFTEEGKAWGADGGKEKKRLEEEIAALEREVLELKREKEEKDKPVGNEEDVYAKFYKAVGDAKATLLRELTAFRLAADEEAASRTASQAHSPLAASPHTASSPTAPPPPVPSPTVPPRTPRPRSSQPAAFRFAPAVERIITRSAESPLISQDENSALRASSNLRNVSDPAPQSVTGSTQEANENAQVGGENIKLKEKGKEAAKSED